MALSTDGWPRDCVQLFSGAPFDTTMNPGKMLGGTIGIVILFSAFFLPFWNLTTGQPGAFDPLYASFRFVLANLGPIQSTGLQQESALAYLILFAGVLVIAAGVFGVYPRRSGILAVVAMVGLTIGPFFLFPNYPFQASNYGIGFWAIWVLAVAALIAGRWQRRISMGQQGSSPGSEVVPPASQTIDRPSASPA